MTNQISVVTCTINLIPQKSRWSATEFWPSEQIESAISVAARDLGYSQLTGYQSFVLHEFLSGKDVFVSLPTGSGKSFCYWVLPGALRKTSDSIIVLVVTPEIPLKISQVHPTHFSGGNSISATTIA